MWLWTAAILVAGAASAGELEDALALEQGGREGDALAAMDALVLRLPNWELPRLEAARLRMKLGRELERAALDAKVARSLAPKNPRAHFLWALVSEERGDEADAVRSYQAALALRPSYEEARLRLAGLYFARGEWELAEQHYCELAFHQPGVSQARLQWIAALEQQGRVEVAEEELIRVRDADPKSIVVARRLAALYERTGRAGLARKIRAEMETPQAEDRKMRPLRKSRL